jgi:hypothetical protein
VGVRQRRIRREDGAGSLRDDARRKWEMEEQERRTGVFLGNRHLEGSLWIGGLCVYALVAKRSEVVYCVRVVLSW